MDVTHRGAHLFENGQVLFHQVVAQLLDFFGLGQQVHDGADSFLLCHFLLLIAGVLKFTTSLPRNRNQPRNI